MIKDLMEGVELLSNVPECKLTGKAPVIHLKHGLTLDDGVLQSPTVILGNVGTGKTTLIEQIETPILDESARCGDNAILFAAKPEVLRSHRPKDIVISVDGTAPAGCWNVFRELDASDPPELIAREVAGDLFSDALKITNNIFFPQAAMDIFRSTLLYMYRYGKAQGVSFDNADLVEFISTTPIYGTEDIPGWMELAEKYPEYFSSARDYLGADEQGCGVLSELRTMISSTFYGSFSQKNGAFSALETLKTGGKRIYLYFDYAKASSSTLKLFRVILNLLLRQSLSNRREHRNWFLLDEFSLLPKLRLQDALSLGREAGFRCIITLQSAQLLTNHYTKEEAETLLSLFPNVVMLRVSDPFSRSILADRFGTAHYRYSYLGMGNKPITVDSVEKVISDYSFSRIVQKGDAIMSFPELSHQPFVYHGHDCCHTQ